MRHIILLDTKIKSSDFLKWKKEDREFWRRIFKTNNQYWVIPYDFSDYPTYIDEDSDVRPTYNYLRDLTKEATEGYSKYGADFVMMCVHEDNWKSDPAGPGGIWGTNYSNLYNGYHFQYCRWDRDNLANTFGTLYHERAHSFDALAQTELGVNIAPLLGIRWYDHNFVHGNGDPYDYIRHKENTDGLVKIAPVMKEAFDNRLKLHVEYLKNRVSVWQSLIRWLTEWYNSTDGVPKA